MKLTAIQEHIHTRVMEISPRLILTSTYRPFAGFHTLGAACDYGSENLHDLKRVFIVLTAEGWGGGISLGIPPAFIHLHVDGRHLTERTWPKCHFIETARWDAATQSCGEVFSPSSHQLDAGQLALWRKTWTAVCSIYK